MGVRVAPSALKHGVEFEDIVSAMTTQALKVIPDFDAPVHRDTSSPRCTSG